MGFNTTVVILNDALSYIENDKDFGKNLVEAINSRNVYEGKRENVPSYSGNGVFGNAATVIESHHADGMIAVLVGGNYGQVLGYAGGYTIDVNKPESVKNALETLAAKYGYRLVKKSVKKSKVDA